MNLEMKILSSILFAFSVWAHQQPTTLALLDVAPDTVAMQLHLPVSELELALGHSLGAKPEAVLKPYLVSHIHPISGQNQAWVVHFLDVKLQSTEQTRGLPFQEAVVDLELKPPAGAGTRNFTLQYDVILHQVVTHKAMVSIRRDWAGGQAGGTPVEVGVIQVNTGTTKINSLSVHLDEGSLWAGFAGMVSLGMQHIEEGADHLLFLLVLLLPATLLLAGKQWGDFGGSTYSLLRLLKIVTAFTVGHSITLLAAALGWLRPPQQPVEVLIALSVLVSAVHAIRPVFAGRETYVAAGFGMVHGLAFATALADLHLGVWGMALSIFGFNLGIEAMQLFVIAVTVPWLILLSLTRFYKWVRIGLGTMAGVAAVGWIANRVTGEGNRIEEVMGAFTSFAPKGVLLLAIIAMLAYAFDQIGQRRISTQTEV